MPSRTIPNLANFSTYTWRSAWSTASSTRFLRRERRSGPPSRTEKTCSIRPAFRWTTRPRSRRLQTHPRATTRPDQNQWGIARPDGTFGLTKRQPVPGIFRVPNNWELDSSGKLIKDYETDEFKAAVGFARDLWSAGSDHPNTPSYGGNGQHRLRGRALCGPDWLLGPVHSELGSSGIGESQRQDISDASVCGRRRHTDAIWRATATSASPSSNSSPRRNG